MQGLAQMLGQGHKLQLLDNMADYDAALSEDVAVVMLTQVSWSLHSTHTLAPCMPHSCWQLGHHAEVGCKLSRA